MPKRFIDTNYFNDPFILSLKPDDKLLYIYFWTICNHAGIFELNETLGNFNLECKNYLIRLMKFMNKYPDKIVQLDENNFIIMNYCKRQYPKGVNTNVRQIMGAINILNEWGIEVINSQSFKLRVKNSYIDSERLNKDYVYVNGNGNGNGKRCGNHLFENSDIYEFENFKEALRAYSNNKYRRADMRYYYDAVKNWAISKGIMRKDWIATAAGFMSRDIRDGKYKVNPKIAPGK